MVPGVEQDPSPVAEPQPPTSGLFQDGGLLGNEGFLRDLKRLLEFPSALASRVPELLMEHAQDSDAAREKIGEAARQVSLDFATVAGGLGAALHLFRASAPAKSSESGTPREWVDDLIGAEVIAEGERDQALAILNQATSEASRAINTIERRRVVENQTLPVVQGISTSADLRAILAKEYTKGLPSEDHNPEVLSLVPVGIVKLQLDEGPSQDVVFQVSKDRLADLLNRLRVLQKQLEAAEDHFERAGTPENG